MISSGSAGTPKALQHRERHGAGGPRRRGPRLATRLASALTFLIVAGCAVALAVAGNGLSYGLAGYWDASVVSVQSGDKVRISAIDLNQTTSAARWKVNEPFWETNALWYDPSRYDARFVIADVRGVVPRTALKRFFGKPSATYRVANWYVLVYRVYRTNLLRKVLPPLGAP